MIKKAIVIIVIFILGFLIGSSKGPKIQEGVEIKAIDKINVINVADKFKEEFTNKKAGFEFDFITQVPTGSVEFFKVKDEVKMHYHPNENHILYILKGTAKGKVGDVEAEVKSGDLVIIPSRVHHTLKNTGTDPLEFILFSTPAFNPEDIQFVE